MKTHKIEFKASVSEPVDELNQYLKSRIEKIGRDCGAVESCEITIDKNDDADNNCEVLAYLGVPRHVYLAKIKNGNFMQAAEKVFDELYRQLNESGWALN